MSCALDNVPTDQPSAPKVDTNQLTKKKLAHAQPASGREHQQLVCTNRANAELKRANFLPQNQFGAQVELRMCLCVCERQREWESNVTETESGSMASERERRRQPPPTLQAVVAVVVVCC